LPSVAFFTEKEKNIQSLHVRSHAFGWWLKEGGGKDEDARHSTLQPCNKEYTSSNCSTSHYNKCSQTEYPAVKVINAHTTNLTNLTNLEPSPIHPQSCYWLIFGKTISVISVSRFRLPLRFTVVKDKYQGRREGGSA
jgi:hypothetical protein